MTDQKNRTRGKRRTDKHGRTDGRLVRVCIGIVRVPGSWRRPSPLVVIDDPDRSFLSRRTRRRVFRSVSSPAAYKHIHNWNLMDYTKTSVTVRPSTGGQFRLNVFCTQPLPPPFPHPPSAIRYTCDCARTRELRVYDDEPLVVRPGESGRHDTPSTYSTGKGCVKRIFIFQIVLPPPKC